MTVYPMADSRREGLPWNVGDRVMFATFDAPGADLREQDGNMGTVEEYSAEHDYVIVRPDGGGWGPIECDPYAVVVPRNRASSGPT